jgi:hypothetical protein
MRNAAKDPVAMYARLAAPPFHRIRRVRPLTVALLLARHRGDNARDKAAPPLPMRVFLMMGLGMVTWTREMTCRVGPHGTVVTRPFQEVDVWADDRVVWVGSNEAREPGIGGARPGSRSGR